MLMNAGVRDKTDLNKVEALIYMQTEYNSLHRVVCNTWQDLNMAMKSCPLATHTVAYKSKCHHW